VINLKKQTGMWLKL